MSPIAADSEVYGKYARLSALSDYLEVRALLGLPLTRAGLADLISDNGWQLPDLIEPPEDFVADDLLQRLDQSRDASDRVISVLRERAEILGNHYPFEVQDSGLALKADVDAVEHPYLAL